MAQVKTEVQVPARTESRISHLICDICGARSPQRESWEKGSFDVNDVTIEHKTGESYPETGSGEYVRVDLCPDCFETKLVPWLRSQGADVRTEEWGF